MKMQPKLLRMALLIFLVAVFLTAASNATPEQATMPYNEVSNVVIDGTIGANEYAGNYSETDITEIDIYWEHNGTVMYIGMESPGKGWIGIAFGPVGTGMDGANTIIGYVDDTTEELTLADNYGQGWTHSSDTSLGGSDDIIAKAGSQSPSKTIIEFAFPLDSGDLYDYPLAAGSTFGFFVAYHDQNDDLTSYHSGRSDSIDLYIEPKPTAENLLPKASFNYTITDFTVEFTDESTDEDGTITSWEWDFNNDRVIDSTEQNPSYTYSEIDKYTVSLTVTDDKGGTNTASKSLKVPLAEQRMQLWITQVAIITIAIAFVSFTAVGIARKIKAKKEGKKHGHT